MEDIQRQVSRLANCDWGRLYSREIPSLIELDARSRLLDVVRTLMTVEVSNPVWVGDLVAYVDDDDLEALAQAARSSHSAVGGVVRMALSFQAPSLMGDLPGRARRRAFAEESFHLSFPSEYRTRSAATAWHQLARRRHPSWALEELPVVSRVALGARAGDRGELRGCVHLMAIERPSALFALDELTGWLRLQVPVAALVGLSNAFVHHDADWNPERLDASERREYSQSPRVAYCEANIVRTPARYRLQNWGQSNGRENLNRLAGAPTFIQGPEIPTCPACELAMTFLLQIEQGVVLEDDTDLVAEGILYAFMCTGCRVTGWLLQHT